MVLVTVSQHDASHLVKILLNIGKIRNNKVNSQHIAVRKRHSAIYDKDIALALYERDIFSDFIKSAQKRHLHRRLYYCLKLFPLFGAGAVESQALAETATLFSFSVFLIF